MSLVLEEEYYGELSEEEEFEPIRVKEVDLPTLNIPIGTWRSDPKRKCINSPVDFFDEDDETNIRSCKARCGLCPVREQCLEWALSSGEKHGIWGGATTRERNKMLRKLVVLNMTPVGPIN